MNIVQFFEHQGILRGGNNLIGSLVNYLELPDQKYLALLITPLQTYLSHIQFTEDLLQRLSA